MPSVANDVSPSRFRRFVDSLLPHSAEVEDHVRLSAQVVVITACGLGGLILGGWIVRMAISPLPWQVHGVVLSSLLLLAISTFLCRRSAVRPAGQAVVAALWIIVFGSALLVGGLQAPVLMLAPIIPMVAAVVLGFRHGVWTTVVVVATVLVFLGLSEAGLELTSPLEAEMAVRGQALLVIIAILMAILMAFVYEKHRGLSEGRREASEELYRKLFRFSKSAVALSTPDGRLVDINDAGLELYGAPTRQEILQLNVRDFYPESADRQQLLDRLAKEGFVRGFTTRQRRLNGEERIVKGTTSVIPGKHGEIQYLLAILHDVTEEHRAAERLDDLVAELEAKNQELERFGYTVSHDLKSPLVTVRGFLGLLERDLQAQDSEKIAVDVMTIRRAVDSMQGLLEDLLQYSRLGHDSGSWTKIPMQALAEEVIELLVGKANDRNVRLEILDPLPSVFGQLVLFRMVWLNLIDNAIKYARSGVEIGCRPSPDGASLRYFVRDDGSGIEAGSEEKIFGLFEKGDDQAAGTGVGLASVKRAVDLHGGRVWVDSQPGQGATFYFTLQRLTGTGSSTGFDAAARLEAP